MKKRITAFLTALALGLLNSGCIGLNLFNEKPLTAFSLEEETDSGLKENWMPDNYKAADRWFTDHGSLSVNNNSVVCVLKQSVIENNAFSADTDEKPLFRTTVYDNSVYHGMYEIIIYRPKSEMKITLAGETYTFNVNEEGKIIAEDFINWLPYYFSDLDKFSEKTGSREISIYDGYIIYANSSNSTTLYIWDMINENEDLVLVKENDYSFTPNTAGASGGTNLRVRAYKPLKDGYYRCDWALSNFLNKEATISKSTTAYFKVSENCTKIEQLADESEYIPEEKKDFRYIFRMDSNEWQSLKTESINQEEFITQADNSSELISSVEDFDAYLKYFGVQRDDFYYTENFFEYYDLLVKMAVDNGNNSYSLKNINYDDEKLSIEYLYDCNTKGDPQNLVQMMVYIPKGQKIPENIIWKNASESEEESPQENIRTIDPDNNGIFTVSDLVSIYSYMLGIDDTVIANPEKSDINEDGEINIIDLVLIKDAILSEHK